MLSAAGKRELDREPSLPLAHRPKKLKLSTPSSHQTATPNLLSMVDSSPYPFLHRRTQLQGLGHDTHAISPRLENQVVTGVSHQLHNEFDGGTTNSTNIPTSHSLALPLRPLNTNITFSPFAFPLRTHSDNIVPTGQPAPTLLLAYFFKRAPSRHLRYAQSILAAPDREIRLTETEGACKSCVEKGLECVTASGKKRCAFCASLGVWKYKCLAGERMEIAGKGEDEDWEEEEEGEEKRLSLILPKLLAYVRTRLPSCHLALAKGILSSTDRIIRLTEADGACSNCLRKGVECVTAPGRKRCAFCASMGNTRYICTAPPHPNRQLGPLPLDASLPNLLAYLSKRKPGAHLGIADRMLNDPKRVVRLSEAEGACTRCVAKGVECVTTPGRRRCAYCSTSGGIRSDCTAVEWMDGEEEDEEEKEEGEMEEEDEEGAFVGPTPTTPVACCSTRQPSPDLRAGNGEEEEEFPAPKPTNHLAHSSPRQASPNLRSVEGEEIEEESPTPIATKLLAYFSERQPSSNVRIGQRYLSDPKRVVRFSEAKGACKNCVRRRFECVTVPGKSRCAYCATGGYSREDKCRAGEAFRWREKEEEEQDERESRRVPTRLLAYFKNRPPSSDLHNGQFFLSDPDRVIRLNATEGACGTCLKKGVECVTAPRQKRCAWGTSVSGIRFHCDAGDIKATKEKERVEEERRNEEVGSPPPIPRSLLDHLLTRAPSQHLHTAQGISKDPRRVVRVTEAEGACAKCMEKKVECVTAPGRKRCAYCASMRYRCLAGEGKGKTGGREGEGGNAADEGPGPFPTTEIEAYLRSRAPGSKVRTAERMLWHPQRVVRIGRAEGACVRCAGIGYECVTVPGRAKCALCTSDSRYRCVVREGENVESGQGVEGVDGEREERVEEDEHEQLGPIAPKIEAYLRSRAPKSKVRAAQGMLRHPERVVRVGKAEGACVHCAGSGFECVTVPGRKRCTFCSSMGDDRYRCVVKEVRRGGEGGGVGDGEREQEGEGERGIDGEGNEKVRDGGEERE